ncbi:MAG: N-acetyltransferase GCN5 [Acidobacteria bacterium OLB17]|nr:MAG: N-acetyltransferase GCN5 [Acidobacteria bacterium OLB17]MCZ2389497.1 GNAT family N-acetyltransferase [Acidobacteriota bacterium]
MPEDGRQKVEIVEFSPSFADDFARLNYEWIEKYFSVERHDREILDNPQKYVIAPGGQIFLAVDAGRAVGAVAIIPAANGVFELTKMAVTPEYRGLGIANSLMDACIEFARERDARTIFLESSRKLGPALALYRKFGFVETPTDPNSEYSRADIRMELAIETPNM